MAEQTEWVEGTTAPKVWALTSGATAVTLSGASVALTLRARDGSLVDTAGKVVIVDEMAGTVRFTPGASDFSAALSPYLATFFVTGAGQVAAFPEPDPLVWTVRRA